jgi:8-oxo-dGTP pyrophosphatase MutT (NUDIX family)
VTDDGGAPVAPPSRVRRGGDQLIPRPEVVRPGPPSPWAHLPAPARRPTVDDVRRFGAALGEPGVQGEQFGEFVPSADRIRPAAVLVPLFPEAGEARVVLTRRPQSMPSHRGEIAFPGGGRKEGDADLAATALREAEEEVGLAPADVEIVGRLDSLGPTVSGFLIAPFLGLLETRPVLHPDPREVDRIFDVPLSELLADGVHHEELWEFAGRPRSIHVFQLDDETVWGATARILTRFLTALVGAPDPEAGSLHG